MNQEKEREGSRRRLPEEQVLAEAEAMLRYALGKGLQPSSGVASAVNEAHRRHAEYSVEKLTRVHKELSSLVTPAKPHTIALIQREQDRNSRRVAAGNAMTKPLLRLWYSLGVLSIARQLNVIALFFLAIVVIGLALSASSPQ